LVRVTPLRWAGVVTALLALFILVMVVSASIGAVRIPPGAVFRSIFPWFGGGGTHGLIIREVRLPRVILAGLVGASLATSGAVFQALLRNPLADPYILGVSGGGALGAILAMAVGVDFTLWGFSSVPIFSFLGSLCTIFFVYAVGSTGGRMATQTLLLTGVIVNAIFSALIMFITSVVDFNQVQSIVFWLMGNLSTIGYGTLLKLSTYSLIGLVALFSLARDLNALSLGEEQALQLGVDVERTKKLAFVGASLITGAVVSVSGLIGFVGLIVPHAVRLIFGPDHRLLLPASMLCGGMFLMAADTVARTVLSPVELPVGVITAMCGGPFFIWLLKRRGSRVI